MGVKEHVEVTPYELGGVGSEVEMCRMFCASHCPENPDGLFQWFLSRPEKFTFGVGTAITNDLRPVGRPAPILKRDGSKLSISIGVETGREPITGLPMYVRRQFDVDLTTLERIQEKSV